MADSKTSHIDLVTGKADWFVQSQVCSDPPKVVEAAVAEHAAGECLAWFFAVRHAR
jgi:hypothetical protein